jgi:hypothetical protein
LRVQQTRGWIALDDIDEAAGMLLGMVASAPQRAAVFRPPAAAVVFADRSTSAQLCGAVLAGLPPIAPID